jgi:ABC-type nitrate/sulfonate/bicarbonate transport system substrate-binding protein
MAERGSEIDRIANMVSRRKFLGMGGLAVGAVALGACGSDDATTTTAAPGTTAAGATETTGAAGVPTTSITDFTVGYNNPNALLRAPMYVGQTLGYFEEVGITGFTINDADDPIPPTIAGDYHVVLFDSDVLFNAVDKGVLDAKMVAVNLGSQPLVLIANAGITSADDLRGKRVGGGRAGLVNEALAKFMLSELGLDWETDVVFTNLTGGSNDWAQAMLTDQVDATIAFPRHVPLAVAEGGSALYTGSLNAPQGGFAMSSEKMAEDPGFVAAWSHAYIQAQRWVKTRDNFDELVRILSEEHAIDLPEAFFDEEVWRIDGEILTQDLGFSPDEMDTWLEFVAPFADVAPDINDRWRGMVDLTGLHAAQTALGLDLNPSADLSTGEEKIANF